MSPMQIPIIALLRYPLGCGIFPLFYLPILINLKVPIGGPTGGTASLNAIYVLATSTDVPVGSLARLSPVNILNSPHTSIFDAAGFPVVPLHPLLVKLVVTVHVPPVGRSRADALTHKCSALTSPDIVSDPGSSPSFATSCGVPIIDTTFPLSIVNSLHAMPFAVIEEKVAVMVLEPDVNPVVSLE
jgi:hypothetical protein